MKLRRTVVLLIAAILLGGYVYWQDRRATDREKAREEAQKLLGLEPGEIQAVRISHSGTLFDLQRRNQNWILARPVAARCDPDEIKAFLDTLATARQEQNIGRGNLARYGLDAPAARLEIDTGTATRRLAIGRVNPLQTMAYVLVDGSENVILTTSALLSLALNNAFGWRDKRMIDVPPDSVHRIRFNGNGEEMLVMSRHPEHGWLVEGETSWRVDPVRAQSALHALGRLKATGVAAENKLDRVKFGVGSRRNSVLLENRDGKVIGDVVWGHGKMEGSINAIVPDKPEVFQMDMKVFELMSSLALDARDEMALPPFEPAKVTRIEVDTPEDEFVLERRSIREWEITSGTVDRLTLDPGRVLGMLEDLSLMKVDDFPTEQPQEFDPPRIRVWLYDGETRVSGIEVGERDPKSNIHMFARGPGEPAAFLLSPTNLLLLPIDPNRLKVDEETAPEALDQG